MSFDAFISYKHGPDDALAEALERALERFARPAFKRRALDVFRDGSEMSTAPDLGEVLRHAMEKSRHMVVLACPAWAQSEWCQREIAWWMEHRGTEGLHILLTDGEIGWDDAAACFDWETTTALPRAHFEGRYNGVPLYLDVRHLLAREDLDLTQPEFRRAVVTVAASLHGRTVDELDGIDSKAHRRLLRLRNGAIAALLVLLASVSGALVFALDQNRRIKAQALEIEDRLRLADAAVELPRSPSGALRKAHDAWQFAIDNELSRDPFADALVRAANRYELFEVDGASFTPAPPLPESGDTVRCVGPLTAERLSSDGAIQRFSLSEDEVDPRLPSCVGGSALSQRFTTVVIGRDTYVFVGPWRPKVAHWFNDPPLGVSASGYFAWADGAVVRTLDHSSSAPYAVYQHSRPVTSVAVSPRAGWIASGTRDGEIRVAPYARPAAGGGGQRQVFGVRVRVASHGIDPITSLVFSDDGSMLQSTDSSGTQRTWWVDGGPGSTLMQLGWGDRLSRQDNNFTWEADDGRLGGPLQRGGRRALRLDEHRSAKPRRGAGRAVPGVEAETQSDEPVADRRWSLRARVRRLPDSPRGASLARSRGDRAAAGRPRAVGPHRGRPRLALRQLEEVLEQMAQAWLDVLEVAAPAQAS